MVSKLNTAHIPFSHSFGDLENLPVCVYADYQQIVIPANDPYGVFTALGDNSLIKLRFTVDVIYL